MTDRVKQILGLLPYILYEDLSLLVWGFETTKAVDVLSWSLRFIWLVTLALLLPTGSLGVLPDTHL